MSMRLLAIDSLRPVDFIHVAIRQDNRDVLHHALIFMIQNVAVEHERSKVALMPRTDFHLIHPLALAGVAEILIQRVSIQTCFKPRYCGSTGPAPFGL